MLMTHPYWGVSFTEFFVVLWKRVLLLLSGELALSALATDEIQLIVLCAVALSAAGIGAFLVLQKMTMLANALSHTLLLGLALAFILGKVDGRAAVLSLSTLVKAALISSLLTVVAVELLRRGAKVQRDASIGLVFTLFFALGVLLVSMKARYAHLGVEAVMGNSDALNRSDMRLALFTLVGNVALLFVFFKRWKMVALDPVFAKSLGLTLFLLQGVLLFQTAVTAVVSFRAVGVFVFLALLVVPFIVARLFAKKLKVALAFAAFIGAGASIVAVALARHLLSVHQMSVSTSGLVALLLGLIFGISWSVKERCAQRGAHKERVQMEAVKG